MQDSKPSHISVEDMQQHDCATYEGEGDDIQKARDSALEQGEVFFVDGSASIDQEMGEKRVGAAVVRMEEAEYGTIIMKQLLRHLSAQAAKLAALIQALKTAKGCYVTIYSDSAYVTTTVHVGLSRWRRRGFRRADSSPVQHAELLNTLISALAEPSVVAVIKCLAHTHNTDEISLGNAAADAAAKKTAYLSKTYQ
ncbi:ribonuclease H-like [Ambystoma mexicanum]|uniref:ribonuclease H-like n=1 Tax=Ambystoma mexicanum TaxID=8296 RepID=UPI0037E6FA7D